MILAVQMWKERGLTPESGAAAVDVLDELLADLYEEGEDAMPVVILCADTEETRELLRKQLDDKDSALHQFADGRVSVADYPEPGVTLQ